MDTNTPQSLSEAVAALCAAMEGQTFIAVSSPVVQAFLLAAGIAPTEAVEAAPVEAPPEPEAAPEPETPPAIELVGALTPEEEAHANNL